MEIADSSGELDDLNVLLKLSSVITECLRMATKSNFFSKKEIIFMDKLLLTRMRQ